MSKEEKNDSKWSILLQSIKDVLKTNNFSKSEVMDLLSVYKSEEKDWQQYVFFRERCYSRNLVDSGNGNYNLMLLTWNPGQGTKIHNHSNSGCFVKVLSGAIREVRYEFPVKGKELIVCGNDLKERDEVLYIDDSDGVHEMKNDTANQAISLHLYTPPFDVCQTYDRKTAETDTCSMSFWSINGIILKSNEAESSFSTPCC